MMPCLSLLCFMVFGPPALLLGDGLTDVARTPVSVQGFGKANACSAWSDGCVLCQRAGGGSAQCSTPGIACTPKAITCSQPASAP